MVINVYSIKHFERKDGTPLFIVQIRSTLLDGVQAFTSEDLAKFYLETVIKKLHKYNVTLTKNNRIRAPKNIIDAYINSEWVRIFDSKEKYLEVYPLAN